MLVLISHIALPPEGDFFGNEYRPVGGNRFRLSKTIQRII